MVYSGGSLNAVTSGIIATAIELGLQSKHIEKLRSEYGKRMVSVARVLEETLPTGFKSHQPRGGYFVWITGPIDSFDSDKFAEFCLDKYKVKVLPGSRCSSVISGATQSMAHPYLMCKNAFRISIAYYEHEELLQSVVTLCKAIKDFRDYSKN